MEITMEQYLTTAHVAMILGVTGLRVRQLANEGKLPCIRLTANGQRLFDPEVVEQIKQEREEKRSLQK
jgi:DNA-binding transcriptional MerR regulator